MLWYHYVFGSILIVASIIITIVVLMQEGRNQNLSGVIGGPSDNYGGKAKGRTVDSKLEKLTKWLIAVFFVIVLAAFLVFLFVV
ncbi:MAG: preprotein translocase subunit SecG [Eubacterium sp.]|nr:preprotein translocase subunit SecG [Eubacterium sp.]